MQPKLAEIKDEEVRNTIVTMYFSPQTFIEWCHQQAKSSGNTILNECANVVQQVNGMTILRNTIIGTIEQGKNKDLQDSNEFLLNICMSIYYTTMV
jgi:hypothetical protein